MNNSDTKEQVKKSTRTDLLKRLNLQTSLPPLQRRNTKLDMKPPNIIKLPGNKTRHYIDRPIRTTPEQALPEEELYQIYITCAQCEGTNLFETRTLFEKIQCIHFYPLV